MFMYIELAGIQSHINTQKSAHRARSSSLIRLLKANYC